MLKIKFLLLASMSYFVCLSQYCVTNVGPTTTADSNVESVLLVGNTSTLNFVGCPGVTNVQDLTGSTTTLSAGGTYTIDIQFGTCNGSYAGAGEVWIDYNNNEIFEANESLGTWTGTPPTPISNITFTLPAGLTNATTRMRIMQHEGGSLPLDPCATFSWGSVMDFTISIVDGFDCSGYTGNTLQDPIQVTSIPYSNSHDNSFCYTSNNNAYASPDVFYLYTPTVPNQQITASLCGSSFDTFLSVFDKNGNTITFNDDGSCGSQSEVYFSTSDLDSIFIIVEGWGSEMGTYEIEIMESLLGTENQYESKISIYPNPSNSSIVIKNLLHEPFQIIDMNGKIVYSETNYNGNEIDISLLKQGVYMIKYKNQHTINFKKLVIN